MKNYHIKFSYNGESELEPQVRRYQATSPGHAFEKCLQKFPGAKLLEGWCEGRIAGITHGRITYAPPSSVRIVAEPTPKAEETKFPFWNDCVGSRRDFPNFAHIEQNKRQKQAAARRCKSNCRN